MKIYEYYFSNTNLSLELKQQIIIGITGTEGPYNKSEILAILATDVWTSAEEE